jgi:hypothetical protein
MVDEANTTSSQPGTGPAPDMGWHPTGVPPTDPGWYPMGTNPNDQSYWDGQTWTGRRHWTVNGWSEVGAPDTAAPGRRMSANPYAPPVSARKRSAPTSLNVGVLLLIISGIALMFGSVGSWIRLSGSAGILTIHGSLNGIDPGISRLIGINGYVTLVCGIVLLVLGGLALTNDDTALAVLTFIVAAGTVVVAVYDMFRVVQKINVTTPAHTSVSVGAGLICVLSAAVLAIIVAVVRLAAR